VQPQQQLLQQLLDQYAVNQVPTIEPLLQQLLATLPGENPTLSYQFRLLSALSNNHWKPYITVFGNSSSTLSRIGLMHHVSCPVEQSRPVSVRNRFIYYMSTGVFHQARNTLQTLCSPVNVQPRSPILNPTGPAQDDVPALPSKRARRVNVKDLSVELARNLSNEWNK